MTELQRLQKRWHTLTGSEMPDEISSLPIDRIRLAVDMTARGEIVFVPKQREPVASDNAECSMVEWDSHKQH